MVGCGAAVDPVATPSAATARAPSSAAVPVASPPPQLAASFVGAIDRELAPPARRNGAAAPTAGAATARAAKLKVEVTGARGRYDAGAFRFAVEAQSAALSECIDAAPVDDRAGVVVVELRYDGEGVMTPPQLVRSEFHSAKVTACIVAALRAVNPARQTPQADESQAHAGARLTVTLAPPPGF